MPANKLFDYPHGAFLMLRLEFVAICQEQELEAMILRIIEMHVEAKRQALFVDAMNKRKAPADQVVEISKDLWVPISYRLFANDLYGIVASENTIKKALKSLEEKKLIFSRTAPKGKYNSPEYQLHIAIIQSLLNVVGKPGYQTLIPSKIEALKNSGYQKLTPSGYQSLILSKIVSCSDDETRVSEIDTNIRKVNDKKPNKKERTYEHSPSSPLVEEEETKPSIWTPEEETLLSWLRSEHIAQSKTTDTVKGQLKELLPAITSIEKLDKLIEFAKCRIRGDDPTVWLGNLVGNTLKFWLQQQETEEEQSALPTSTQKATDDEIRALYDEILDEHPTLDLQPCISSDNQHYLLLQWGKEDWQVIEIASADEWRNQVRPDAFVINKALAYSEMQLQVATA